MLTLVPETIETYAQRHCEDETVLMRELAAETRKRTAMPQMMVGPIEGSFLKLLVQLSGARNALEIGTFTGYSALWIAAGLGAEGRLVTCDVDEETVAIAKSYWARADYGWKIEPRVAPALKTLKSLREPVDFVFIDADKENYGNYWEAVLPLLRPGGIVVADNVLWSGKVLDPKEPSDIALAAFNAQVKKDARVDRAMLTVRDGMLVARKK